jgi:hypothetical protein
MLILLLVNLALQMQHQNLKGEVEKIWQMKFVDSFKDLMLQVIQLIYLNFLS